MGAELFTMDWVEHRLFFSYLAVLRQGGGSLKPVWSIPALRQYP
ncbi:MAG: hypothetical protein ACLSB9_36670 [Hydrogeniiclostridium mannosilyticum]